MRNLKSIEHADLAEPAARARGHIEAKQISIALGAGSQRFTAVQDVSFNIEPGEFICILGPSGCGKSTLLSAIAGHLKTTKGRIEVDGNAIAGPSVKRGLVFQQHTLFPWKTVLDNVAFGLKMQGVKRAERNLRALEFLRLVGLADFAECFPAQLSGGMQQRVEIARALINNPQVLLMDEPFGALDAQTRLMMQELLLSIWTRVRTTIVFVTHDIDEALFLADRIFVLTQRPGRIGEELKLDFPRPRTADLVTSNEFVRLKRRCLGLIRGTATNISALHLAPGSTQLASQDQI